MSLSRRGAIAGAVTAGLAAASPAYAGTAAALRSPADWIPITLDAQHIRVQVDLDGEPFSAIVDSGAGASVIDVKIARRLGLRALGGLTAQGIGASAAGGIAGPVELRLGGTALTLRQVAVVDLSVLRQAGDDTFIILGRDLFEPRVIRLDFAARRMRLEAEGDFSEPADQFVPLLATPQSLRRTWVSLAGGAPSAAEFDLGNGSTLLVSREHAEARGLLNGRRTSTWISAGVEGVTRYVTATLDQVRFGSATFHDVPMDVYPTWSTPLVPVNIGLPMLARFELATDYPHDRLWLGPEPRIEPPFPRDRSGLACRRDGGAMQVLHVATGSPAARGGWQVGDRITHVDGVPASTASTGWGMEAAGRVCVLTLSDRTTRSLTLETYY